MADMTTSKVTRGGRWGNHKGMGFPISHQAVLSTAQRRGDTGDWRARFMEAVDHIRVAGLADHSAGWETTASPHIRVQGLADHSAGWETTASPHIRVQGLGVRPSRRKVNDTDPAKTLRQRLDNANNHFRKKAAEVFGDEDAVRLLARLYQAVVVDIADFDACKDGVSLAKLTAANFCEIGAKSIYITGAGQNFIDAINSDE